MLSVSALKDKGYVVVFQDGHVPIRSKGATQDAIVMLIVKQGKLYRLLDQPVCGSKGILDQGLMSVTESEQEAPKIELIPRTQSSNPKDGHEASSSTIKTSWYELTLMDAQE